MSSVLNVDTIANKAGSGPVGLTKQDAAKFWTAYDAVADSVSGSFNQSSITDQSTGNHFFSFTNSFGSSTDKAAFANAWNTTNASSVDADGTRGGAQATIGGVTNFRACLLLMCLLEQLMARLEAAMAQRKITKLSTAQFTETSHNGKPTQSRYNHRRNHGWLYCGDRRGQLDHNEFAAGFGEGVG